MQSDLAASNTKSHANPPPKRSAQWVRWFLLLPAMGAAFVGAGVLSGLPCVVFNFEAGLLWVGPLCAAAWVTTAYGMAPSHKVRTAAIAYICGALAAWFLTGTAPSLPGGRFLMSALTWAGGLIPLLISLPWLRGAEYTAPGRPISHVFHSVRQLLQKGKESMKKSTPIRHVQSARRWIRPFAMLILLSFGAYALARGIIDIVPQERQGLYMRLGRYVRTVDPGLHLKIPFIDRIIGVPVKERQGYIQHVDAMTQDNVIMKVSLQYTYEVTDAERYRLEVQQPDFIIKEFVQGKLRDILNTISMNDVMKKRMELNQRITKDLADKERDFGIHFKLVQVQGAFPPPEVQEAIKQRMVAEQSTVAAKEEATQKQIIADATFYEARKQTEAARYEIEETAKARKESIRMLLGELAKHESLGPKYLEYLTSQELKDNSKWIISGDRVPQIHLDTQTAMQ